MLVGSIRSILHYANVHGLGNRYSNRCSCVVIDDVRRTFEEDIGRCFVHIQVAKRLQRVMAAALHLEGKLIPPSPRQPYPRHTRFEGTALPSEKAVHALRG